MNNITISEDNLILQETNESGKFLIIKKNDTTITEKDLILFKYLFIKYLKLKYKENFEKIISIIFLDINCSIETINSNNYLVVYNYNDIEYLLDDKTNGMKKTIKLLFPKKK